MADRKTDGRDVIGTVTLMSGEVLTVCMPTTGDVIDGTAEGKAPFTCMIEAATGMTITAFKRLPVTDGTRVMTMLNDAVESVNAYLDHVNKKAKH